jgi:hypothetical protein
MEQQKEENMRLKKFISGQTNLCFAEQTEWILIDT